jgi:hypothetical protein
LAIGSNLSYSSVPTSIGQVISQADGIFYRGANETTALGYTHKVSINGTQLGWSSVTSPVSTPYAGAPGCVQIYGTAQSNTGTPVCLARVMGLYEFRVRS